MLYGFSFVTLLASWIVSVAGRYSALECNAGYFQLDLHQHNCTKVPFVTCYQQMQMVVEGCRVTVVSQLEEVSHQLFPCQSTYIEANISRVGQARGDVKINLMQGEADRANSTRLIADPAAREVPPMVELSYVPSTRRLVVSYNCWTCTMMHNVVPMDDEDEAIPVPDRNSTPGGISPVVPPGQVTSSLPSGGAADTGRRWWRSVLVPALAVLFSSTVILVIVLPIIIIKQQYSSASTHYHSNLMGCLGRRWEGDDDVPLLHPSRRRHGLLGGWVSKRKPRLMVVSARGRYKSRRYPQVTQAPSLPPIPEGYEDHHLDRGDERESPYAGLLGCVLQGPPLV